METQVPDEAAGRRVTREDMTWPNPSGRRALPEKTGGAAADGGFKTRGFSIYFLRVRRPVLQRSELGVSEKQKRFTVTACLCARRVAAKIENQRLRQIRPLSF